MVHIDIAHTTRQLAANTQQRVSRFDGAVAHNDIFARSVESPRIVVAARLDNYGIVALVKGAALDKEVARHLQIDAVVVMAVSLDIQVTNKAFIAHIKVYCPEWAVLDAETIEQYVRATIEVYEVRAEVVFADSHLSLLDGYAIRHLVI